MSHDVNLRRNIDRHSIVFAAWHHAAAGGLSSLIFVEEFPSPLLNLTFRFLITVLLVAVELSSVPFGSELTVSIFPECSAFEIMDSRLQT